MEVLRPGTTVYVGENRDIPAHIQRITITPSLGVTYEVGWWAGNEFKEKWLFPDDFRVDKSVYITIGFK